MNLFSRRNRSADEASIPHEMEQTHVLPMDGWRQSDTLSLSQATDELLVVRARQGDDLAMEEVFQRYRQPVYRFVYRFAASREEAEDITQDVFLKVFEHLHSFREECRFSTWIMRIAANLCTDRARARQRRDNLVKQEAAHRLDWMTHPHPADPVDNAHRDAVQVAFHQALAMLPEHHRKTIILRDLEERSYEELSQILRCTMGGAKLRVLRARRALKAKLAPLLKQLGELPDDFDL